MNIYNNEYVYYTYSFFHFPIKILTILHKYTILGYICNYIVFDTFIFQK